MLQALAAAAVAASSAPAAPASVEGVEITARRPLTGTLQQGVQAYRPEFFTPARPSTAMDMIQWLPGFAFEDMRDLRGLGDAGGNVLIDGKPPTAKNDTLATVLRRIPSSQVDRVDIIVGSAPGIDMRGRPVIANVVLKKTAAPRGSVQVQAQVFADGRVAPELVLTGSRNVGGRAAEGSLTVNQRVFGAVPWGSGVWVRRDGAGREVFRADQRAYADGPSLIGAGSYEFPVAGGRLKLTGSGRWFETAIDDTAILRGSGEAYVLTIRDTYRQVEAGLRYERPVGRRTTLESQALQRINWHVNKSSTRRPPIDTDLAEPDRVTETVLRNVLRYRPDDRLTLEATAEGALNGLVTTSRLLVAGVPTPLAAGDVEVHEQRGDLGAAATWKPSSRYGLTAGLRVEASHLTSERDVVLSRNLSFVKPRAVFTWSPDARTQARLRLEHEVGQINFFNFVATAEFNSGVVRSGNPNLRPQRAYVVEAVLEKQFWTGASVVTTLRSKALKDVVDARPIGSSDLIQLGNIGDGRQTDLVTTLTLPLKRLGLGGVMAKATVTRSWHRVTDPTTGERRALSFARKFSGDFHLTHDLPRWKSNWGADLNYMGPSTLFRPTTIERTENDIWVLNIFVEYRPRPNLVLRLEGLNVLDARSRQTISNYAGRRDVAPLLFADDRVLGIRPAVQFRVRRTLN